MGVGSQSYAPVTLPPERDTVPIVQGAGWAPAPVWMGAGNLALIGIRSLDHTARSESLYRLSHSGPRTGCWGRYLGFRRTRWQRTEGNVQYNDMDRSPNSVWLVKSRKMIWAGHVALTGKSEMCTVFCEETWGKEVARRPRHRWENSIKIDLKTSKGGVDWIDTWGLGSVAHCFECGNEALGSIKCGHFLD